MTATAAAPALKIDELMKWAVIGLGVVVIYKVVSDVEAVGSSVASAVSATGQAAKSFVLPQSGYSIVLGDGREIGYNDPNITYPGVLDRNFYTWGKPIFYYGGRAYQMQSGSPDETGTFYAVAV